jgi:hypothetical protein
MGKLGTRMRRARLGSGGHSTASSSPDDRRDRSHLFGALLSLYEGCFLVPWGGGGGGGRECPFKTVKVIIKNFKEAFSSVPNPDPIGFRFFGLPDLKSEVPYGPGSFHYPAKILRKTFISTIL